jgi:lysyl-tRNA synthetase class 2
MLNIATEPFWHATASLQNLRHRSAILAKVRAFFAARDVLEVETPLLGSSTATDPHIHSFLVPHVYSAQKAGYLQTSPEFPMKRLLAQGIGSIYQISKAFRCGERGRLHNPEFTLLEWYRVGFDHHRLMDEIDALMHEILHTTAADRMTYAEAFATYLHLDCERSTVAQLQACAKQQQLDCHGVDNELVANVADSGDKDFWLQLLVSHCIEPHLGKDRPIFITDFPASQAALAKLNAANPLVADRFELYFKGIELANGYHELCDAREQRRRFLADNAQRAQHNLPLIPIDEFLLAALENGMPACAGVALGMDRLIMLACGAHAVEEVMSFTIERI